MVARQWRARTRREGSVRQQGRRANFSAAINGRQVGMSDKERCSALSRGLRADCRLRVHVSWKRGRQSAGDGMARVRASGGREVPRLPIAIPRNGYVLQLRTAVTISRACRARRARLLC